MFHKFSALSMHILLLYIFMTHQLNFVTARMVRRPEGAVKGKWLTLSGHPPAIIAHRGEKILMPEHTLGSYEIACIEGADYVEPDLVLTKDNHLVCYHDLTLKEGTNIANVSELAYLRRNYTGPLGVTNVTILEDWFIPDLTLAQIKKLHVVQPSIGIRPQYFSSIFQIPTFQEYLDVVHKMSFNLNTSIGVIPELKHSDFINPRWPDEFHMEKRVLKVLKQYGYPIQRDDLSSCSTPSNDSIPCGHLVIQSFHRTSLEYLNSVSHIELMMLVDEDPSLLTLRALDHVSNFATYYSVWKEFLFNGVEAVLRAKDMPWNQTQIEEEGGFVPKETFVEEVHGRKMLMGIYTLYDSREPSRMGCSLECRPENKTYELFHYFGLGVDAIFVENIKEASELRLKYGYELDSCSGSGRRRNFGIASVLSLGIIVAGFQHIVI